MEEDNGTEKEGTPQGSDDASHLEIRIGKDGKVESEYSLVKFNRWEDIGFQRPLADFFYEYFFFIVVLAVGLFFFAVVYPLIYPFPEIHGYNDVAKVVFSWAYSIFDTGTAFGIIQFVSHYRIKNPKKMIEYVQFFIWYQMFTGLVQILIISWYIFSYLTSSNLSYLTWVFLIICIQQYPSWLSVFKDSLRGLQQFNKYQILKFLGDQGFQQVTYILFILVGGYLGGLNPQIGSLMGMVIGQALGKYIDDFFTMFLSAHYFNKAMKPFGYSVRDCFRVSFGWDVVKDSIWFGFQSAIIPIIDSVSKIIVVSMYIETIPHYSTFIALASIAGEISGFITVKDFQMTATFGESYMNGKKKLAQFYMESAIKWNGFLMTFTTIIVLCALPIVMQEIVAIPGFENYVLAVPFVIPSIVKKLMSSFVSFTDGALAGAKKIKFLTLIRVLEEIFEVFFVWLFLFVFRFQDVFGFQGVVFILAFEHAFPKLIKTIMGFLFVHYKIVKVKVNWWQTLIVPLIASAPLVVFTLVFNAYLFDPLRNAFSFLDEYASIAPAALLLLILLIIIPLFVYMPLSGYLGGWDDFQMLTLRKALDLGGFMKPFVNLFYVTINFGVKKSKLHNRFKIPWDDAMREINELMEIKEGQLVDKS
ncbi:MAG: hypothetical protein ACFFCS_06110 [Candidatus Hodarchaeota archaeon]